MGSGLSQAVTVHVSLPLPRGLRPSPSALAPSPPNELWLIPTALSSSSLQEAPPWGPLLHGPLPQSVLSRGNHSHGCPLHPFLVTLVHLRISQGCGFLTDVCLPPDCDDRGWIVLGPSCTPGTQPRAWPESMFNKWLLNEWRAGLPVLGQELSCCQAPASEAGPRVHRLGQLQPHPGLLMGLSLPSVCLSTELKKHR